MQEHAEGPRSAPMKECVQCGAQLKSDEKVCPKCETAQPGHPAQPAEKTDE